MTNYYDEILIEIENLIKEGKYGDANFLVQKRTKHAIYSCRYRTKVKEF